MKHKESKMQSIVSEELSSVETLKLQVEISVYDPVSEELSSVETIM